MRRCLKISFLLLFSALLLVVPNMLTAQELEDNIEIDTIEKVEKYPLRVRFVVGGGPAWYSVTTKDDYQRTRVPDEHLFSALWVSQYYLNSDQESILSGYQITDVIPKSRFGFSIGLAFEKQISSKIDLQVVPTWTLTEWSVTYLTELIDINGQVFGQYEVLWKDVNAAYLELPVLVKYKPFETPFFLVAGISPKIKIRMKDNLYYPPPQNQFDMSVDFGAGYQFKKRLGVQVKMSLGLLDVIKGREEDPMFFYLPLESVRTNRLEIVLVF